MHFHEHPLELETIQTSGEESAQQKTLNQSKRPRLSCSHQTACWPRGWWKWPRHQCSKLLGTPLSLETFSAHAMWSCDTNHHVTFIRSAAPAAVLLTGALATTTVAEAASERAQQIVLEVPKSWILDTHFNVLCFNLASSQRLVRHAYSRTPLETTQSSGEESAQQKATKPIQTASVVVVSPDGSLAKRVVEVASASVQQAAWDTLVS